MHKYLSVDEVFMHYT